MREIKIVSRYDSSKVLASGKCESIKDCLDKNRGADLRGANLGGADLREAKGYLNSHSFLQEVIRQQKVETFTDKEWVCIGHICIQRLCWKSIKNRFDKTAMRVFKKLSKVGFDEWEAKYISIKEV